MKNFFTRIGVAILCAFLAYGFAPNDNDPKLTRQKVSSVFIQERNVNYPEIFHTPSVNRESILSGYVKEGFEGTLFPPAGWTSVSVQGANVWSRATDEHHTGVASAKITYQSTTGLDWLIMPRFSATATDSIVFWMKLDFQGYQPDSLGIKVSTTDSNVASFTGTVLSLREGVNYPPDDDNWYRFAAYVGMYAGQNIFVAFKHFNADGDGLYIDDVALGTPPANDIAASSIDMSSFVQVNSATAPKGTFTNNGTAGNSFPVTMIISPGGYTSTQNVTSLAPGSSSQVTFDNWIPAAAGTYNVTMISQLGTDSDRGNDTLRMTVNVHNPFSNNGWSQKTAMPSAKWANGTAFYRSGTYPNDTGFVYVVTGYDGAFANSTEVVRYNTVTDTWQTMAPIPTSRGQVSAVTVGSKIYVPGGYTGSFAPTNQLAIYDIPTNTWSTGANLPQAVGDYAIGVYGDSLIYVMGGYSGSADVNLVQVYSTNTNTWSAGTPLTWTAVSGNRGGIVGNKIIVACGYSQVLGNATKQARVGTIDPVNPTNITWTAAPDFPYTTGRAGAGPLEIRRNGTSVNKSYVLFTAGDPNGAGTTVLNGTWVFDFADNTWKIGPNKPSAVSNLMQVVSFQQGDSVYMMSTGGYNGVSIITNNERINMGAVPSVVSLVSPSNGATGVPVNTTLDWSDATVAASYRLQIATDAGFSSLVKDTTISSSSYAVPAGLLNHLTQYHWRVQAVNAMGTTIFTNAFNFTTVLAPPAALSLVSPNNGAVGQPTSLNLRWNKTATSASYHVQLATDSLFTSIIVNDSTLTDSIRAVSGLTPLQRYWWRVRGKNAGGNGGFSPVFNFKIVGPATTVNQFFPTNNAVNLPVNINFVWLRAADQTKPFKKSGAQTDESGIGNYWFELVTDTVGMANLVRDTTLTDTIKTVNGLNNITNYYWRVRAKNEIGYGSFAPWFKFTTIVPAPAVPSLVTPPNNSTNISLSLDLRWNPVQYAANYRVQVATDSSFSTIIVNDSTVTDTSRTLTGLNTFTKYFWRVQSKNIAGTSAYSGTYNFTTIVSAPAAPVLVSPANNAVNISLTPLLNWDTVNFANSFGLQVATDSAFNNTVVDTAALNITQFQVPAGRLQNSIKYYWRVNATSAGGTGNYSSAFTFTTIVQTPSAPVLVSPLNGSFGQSTTPLLDWDSVGAAQIYRVQLSTDSTFATTVFDSAGVTMAQVTVPSGLLSGETKYYWRVNGTNTAGSGSYSAVWNFTTLGVGIALNNGVIPTEFKLYNNYPNPFNPSTKVRFDIPKSGLVSLKIYDITGREVAVLVNGSLAPGQYEYTWDAAGFTSGVYFYRIVTEGYVHTMRMMLLK